MERTEIREDLENLYHWDRIESTFETIDGIDTLTRSLRVYDDGTSKAEEVSASGSVILYNDSPEGSGVRPWDSIEIRHNQDGRLDNRITFFDDGTERRENYENGVLRELFQFDNPAESHDGVETWSSIETRFDSDGQLESRGTVNDDGTLREEAFENGVLRQIVQYDNPSESHDGVEPWSSIETRFDQDGKIEARGIINDDGTLREETFEDGIIRTIVQYDNPSETNDGVQPWSIIETRFNEAGGRTAKTIIDDDGSQKTETFQNGIRTRVEVREERIGTFSGITTEEVYSADYDPVTGELSQRSATDANGVIRTEVFEDRVRVSLTLTDSSPSTEIWRTIETTFTDALVASRTTIFHDRDQRVETFADGRITSILDSHSVFLGNPSSVFSADGTPDSGLNLRLGIDQRETIFGEDGLVETKRTIYSDGDQTVALYENNRIFEQQLNDADGDQPWLARSILYNASGAITDTIEFYSEAELPTDFLLPVELVSPTPNETPPPVTTFGGGSGSDRAPTTDTFPPGDGSGGGEPPSVDTFTPGGGISVTPGSGVTTSPVEIDMTPPSLEDFANAGIAVNAGSGLTLTGGGSSPTPSATTFESMDSGPDILDLM